MSKPTIEDIASDLLDGHKSRSTLALALVSFALVADRFVKHLCVEADARREDQLLRTRLALMEKAIREAITDDGFHGESHKILTDALVLGGDEDEE